MRHGGTWAIGIAAGLWAASPALAQTSVSPGVFPGDLPAPMADGRMLGHLPYPEIARGELVSAPAGFGFGQPCLVQRDAAPDLARMLTAATLTPGVGATLRGISCFRSIAHQRAVFCHNGRPGRCGDAAMRARSVGPPGYSEHATGYAIDFGIRPSKGCPDVDTCMATTAAGRWLIGHAADFGFELSFPMGNAQGVTWEPWHWRWVGANVNVTGAARARLAFARARAAYPGSPRVTDISDLWLKPPSVPPPVVLPQLLPPPIVAPVDNRRRRKWFRP